MNHPHQKHTGAAQAMRAVRYAQQHGMLQPPTAFECADCGNPAQVYDHRDYGRPLDVEPVCRVCNHERGSAKPAEDGDPPIPVKTEAAGYILSKYGIAPVSFVAFDFYPIKRRK